MTISVSIHQWAVQYQIPLHAVHSLLAMLGAYEPAFQPQSVGSGSEVKVQSELRLNASKMGGRLWRNNRGAGYMQDGSFVRWGLANDSKQMNDKIKSHDLIGIKPVLITPEMIGCVIGQFWSKEAKSENWRFTGTAHEEAQLAWAILINSLGGDAAFANRGDAL